MENTIVIVTSDHGEAFSEHGYYAHGSGLHQEILHVPLLFRGPGIPAGRRVRMPVGLVDLMPTLLELAGAPPVRGMTGRSFAHVVRGAPPDEDAESRPFFSEAWREMRVTFDAEGRLRPTPFPQPSFAVRVGDRKLIRYRDGEGFRYSYYDLATDPGERRDLYPEDPAGARDLRELIEAYTPHTAELHSRLMQGSEEAIPLDWERAERLRALGYIE
jgi:arylsulfatase A-like enzyme